LNVGEEPTVVDGEVEGFYAMEVEEANGGLLGGDFMTNAAKVLV